METNLNPRASRSKLVLIKALGLPNKDSVPSATNDVIDSVKNLRGRIDTGPDPFRRCRDGERTAHLLSLLGKWYGQGKPYDEVLLLARGWNSENFEALPDKKVRDMCVSMLRTHEHNHPPAANEPKIVEPLFDLDAARVDHFLDYDPPYARWLLDDCLRLGKVGLLVAPGGTGKSQLALQLAIAVATGEPLAGYWQVGESGPVLALFAEEDGEELHRRLWSILRALASRSDYEFIRAKLRENLFLKAMTGESCRMTSADAKGAVLRTDFAERVIAMLRDLPEVKLVILDPVSRFRGGNENASDDATAFVECAELIAKRTGATVLLVHHANKQSMAGTDQTQAAARGSSALTDGVRFQWNLAPLSEDDTKKLNLADGTRKDYLSVKVTKNNYAPSGDVVYLRRAEHGVLHHCDLQQLAVPTVAEKIRLIVELVRDAAAKGEKFSKSSFARTHGGRNAVVSGLFDGRPPQSQD